MGKSAEEKNEIERLIGAELIEAVERTVRECFRANRDLWAEIIRAEFSPADLGQAAAVVDGGGEWTKIESLSRLRGAVGGRFDSLKRRWLGAGFPLKEHRGERAHSAECDPAGWRELASWISEQGFESRIADPGRDYLFEIRKLSS